MLRQPAREKWKSGHSWPHKINQLKVVGLSRLLTLKDKSYLTRDRGSQEPLFHVI